MDMHSTILEAEVLPIPDVTKTTESTVKKIARITKSGFKKFVKWYLDGAQYYGRAEMMKHDWRWRPPYHIRGLY